MKQLILIILLLIIHVSSVYAEGTRYVVDRTQIGLRTGTSTSNKVLQWLPTGMKLTLVEVGEDRNYSLVRTPEGKEGWVLSRYLMDAPPARERLSSALQQLTEKETQIRELKEQLQNTSGGKTEAEKERNSLNEQNSLLSKQLADIRRVAADAIRTSAENKSLNTKIVDMEQEIQLLRQENESLGDRSARNWFMTGSVVVVISMLFGIMLTRIRWRKKSSWGEL